MATISLANGLGGPAGSSLGIRKPLIVNGNVWYVNADTGTDGAAPAGKDSRNPLATLSQAVTNSASGDIIVLMDGHEETITSTITIAKSLILVGTGSNAGLPTVKLTPNQATSMLDIDGAAFFHMHNIWIEENLQANSAARIDLSSVSHSYYKGLYVQCGQYDDTGAFSIASGSVFFDSCTFISTATSVATAPHSAILDHAVSDVVMMRDVVIDNGTVGFSNIFAVDLNSATTHMQFESMSLLRGAKVRVLDASVGFINIETATSDARVDWEDVV